MVDANCSRRFWRRCGPTARLILVGDADQLPSVGPGNILSEILRAGTLPTVRLTEIFRQAGKSLIVQNAHRIVNGQMPQKGGKQDDFFMIEALGLACQRLVCDLVSARLPAAYGFDPVRDIQVLCPTKVGPTGSVELNSQTAAAFEPARAGQAPDRQRRRQPHPAPGRQGHADQKRLRHLLRAGRRRVRRGGLQRRHRHRHGGGPGQPHRHRADGRPPLHLRRRPAGRAGPGYAITIHKSQGSEFPAVVLPAADVPARLCYRNLLYTGVTRAAGCACCAAARAPSAPWWKTCARTCGFPACGFMLQGEGLEE